MKRKRNIKSIIILGIVVGFFVLIKSQFPLFKLSSSAMSPKLDVGDVILANNFFNDFKRNDICIFRFNNQNQISRLVGLPGDKVEIVNGVLFVNNMEVSTIETKFNYKIYTDVKCANKDSSFVKLFKEINKYGEYIVDLTMQKANEVAHYDCVNSVHKIIHPKGYEYKFLEQPIFPNRTDFNWSRDNFGPIHIPKKGDFKNNYYFVLGDNRHQSLDSRCFGLVSEEKMEGIVLRTLYLSNEKD